MGTGLLEPSIKTERKTIPSHRQWQSPLSSNALHLYFSQEAAQSPNVTWVGRLSFQSPRKRSREKRAACSLEPGVTIT